MNKGFTLKLDTRKNGIDSIFKPWQTEAVNLLLETNEYHSSNEMHKRLRARGHDISRASASNFLQGLSEMGIVTKKGKVSRGGYKGIYQTSDSRYEFNDKIVKLFCLKLYESFPEIEWLKDIWEEETA